MALPPALDSVGDMFRNALLFLVGAGFVAVAAAIALTSGDARVGREALVVMLFFGGCMIVGAVDVAATRWPARPRWGADFLEVRNNRVRLGAFGLAAAAWSAAGIVGLGTTVFPAVLSWVLIAFGGLCALFLLSSAADGRVKVRVDREGIADFRLIARKIPWSDVQMAGVSMEGGLPVLVVWLKDASPYEQARPWLARMLRRQIDPMHFVNLTLAGAPDDIKEAIRRWAPPWVLESLPPKRAWG